MSKHLPPVPPANRSPKGTGDKSALDVDTSNTTPEQKAARNFDEQGHQGNTKQNTTHQGYQQDR